MKVKPLWLNYLLKDLPFVIIAMEVGRDTNIEITAVFYPILSQSPNLWK
jgi:hypothetical protein